ncbi:MAG: DNA phosphorothioation-associated putative methyltransferase [Desulfamplus sp.]|nr:DNA phosphorothioation-associated putative methyltransferase [Desulfamplus sp.]
MNFTEYKKNVLSLTIGKKLSDAVYIELEAFNQTADDTFIQFFQSIIKTIQLDTPYNVIKFFKSQFKISLLTYKDLWSIPHPELEHSFNIDLATAKVSRFNYVNSENPPILHRKELLILPEHPDIKKFQALTQAEEKEGLYVNTKIIGFKKNWDKLLKEKRLSYKGHELIKSLQSTSESSQLYNEDNSKLIQRHKTAISRNNFSKPIQTLMEYDLLNQETTFFDYGCGQGDDIKALQQLGFKAVGWDPVFQPLSPKIPSEIVNLGFVINVIEDAIERIEVLHNAFDLTQTLLVVSAMLTKVNSEVAGTPYRDGVITQKGTFQKYFTQSELCQFIEDVLETPAIAVGPGVFYIFKHPEDYQDMLFRRSRKRINWNELSLRLYPDKVERKRAQLDELFENNKEIFESFWQTMLDIGRLPQQNEFPQYSELKSISGSIAAAKKLFVDKYGSKTLEQAFEMRKKDILVYLALSNFKKHTPFKHLSTKLRTDIKTFVGSYRQGVEKSLKLLFEMGEEGRIESLCNATTFGVFDHKALYFHRSLIPRLHPVLRIMIGCAEVLYGDLSDADVIKIHKKSGKITALVYDDFENNALPELKLRIKINLIKQEIGIFDHQLIEWGQLLYFKEQYVTPEHPLYCQWADFSHKISEKTGIKQGVIRGPSKQEFEMILKEKHLTRNLTI